MSRFEDPVIITNSISGTVANRDQCPAIPYTPEEYGAEARRAVDEGASMIHIHARTPDGTPSYEIEDFQAITEAILGAVDDVIVNYSTGAIGVPIEKRIEYLRALRPDVAALNMGSMNYAKYSRRRKDFVFKAVFENSFDTIIEFVSAMRELEIAARYLPGTAGLSIGGDWYDVLPLPDGRVLLAIGDVVGHGVRAAAVMGRARAATPSGTRAACACSTSAASFCFRSSFRCCSRRCPRDRRGVGDACDRRGRGLRRNPVGRTPLPRGGIAQGKAQTCQVGKSAAAESLRRLGRRGRSSRPLAACTSDDVVRRARRARGHPFARRSRAVPARSGVRTHARRTRSRDAGRLNSPLEDRRGPGAQQDHADRP